MKPAWTAQSRTGPVRKYKQLEVFAVEGLIAIHEDNPEDDVEWQVVTPTEMLNRMRSVRDSLNYRGRTRSEESQWRRQERDEVLRGLQELSEVVREARRMGDPSDPKVQAYWERHRRNSTISLSAGCDAAGYPELPKVPLGNFTGKTVAADVPTVYTPPKRKAKGGLIIEV